MFYYFIKYIFFNKLVRFISSGISLAINIWRQYQVTDTQWNNYTERLPDIKQRGEES